MENEEKYGENNLGLKIGTKDEKLWENVKREALILIEQSENNLKVQKEILKMAERLIKEEQEKTKI